MIRDRSRLSSIATVSHEDIKSWAEARDARPTQMHQFDAEAPQDHLKFRFPGERFPGEEDLSWQEFFDIFDRSQLEFHYEDIADDAVENRNVYQFRPREMS